MNEEFKVLEDKIDCKLESYCKELYEFVWELIICDSLDDCDLLCGSVLIIGCIE